MIKTTRGKLFFSQFDSWESPPKKGEPVGDSQVFLGNILFFNDKPHSVVQIEESEIALADLNQTFGIVEDLEKKYYGKEATNKAKKQIAEWTVKINNFQGND